MYIYVFRKHFHIFLLPLYRPDPIFFNLKTFFPLTLPTAKGRILLVAILSDELPDWWRHLSLCLLGDSAVYPPFKTVIYNKIYSRSGEFRFEISIVEAKLGPLSVKIS